MITTAVFDTKPYDRESLQQASANDGIKWHFLDFRLTQDTAAAAKNVRAVCVFVNDQLDLPFLEVLGKARVELVALGYAGFNDVELRREIETYGNASSCRAARRCRTCRSAAAHAEPQDPSRIQARTRAELFAHRTGAVPQLLEKQGDSKLEPRPELNLPRDKCYEENGAEQPKQPGFGGIAPSN